MHAERLALPRGEIKPGEIPTCDVTKMTYVFSDGKQTKVTVLRPSSAASFQILIDPRFTERGIVLDNKRLISQPATQKAWQGETVGKPPEEFVQTVGAERNAFHPTNALWQTEAFYVKDGHLEFVGNDKDVITGNFTVLGYKDGQWGIHNVSLNNGQPDEEHAQALQDMKVGFDIPLLVKDGEVQPLETYIGHPRLLADYRNVFDFAAGKQLPAEYWLHIRSLLPQTEEEGKRLLHAESVVTDSEGVLGPTEVAKLKKIIAEFGLDNTLKIDELGDATRLQIASKLPFNRIPLFGIGHDAKNNLVVVAIDGRQTNSAGATLEEAAMIMKDNGIINGGLGSAGGDVWIVGKDNHTVNSPSLQNSRPVPSVLVIQ